MNTDHRRMRVEPRGTPEPAAQRNPVQKGWRQEYHTERPHRGLGQRTPAEYAATFTPEEGHSSATILRC